MRPIKLTVAGLHSFREKQEIDFTSLCEGGVFGIFGPTGSGKSSLLDAMTLALYGKVERALNNTQGIMNQAENELKVSFTFELGNANGTKKYKVERAFKRNDELRLKTANCRILDMTEETLVLAEKINEVNDKVQELLGLTVDDFTRAVVLPQGKFAEFLQLKGADRRKMLQRLFNLEKYGDELNDKLRQEVQHFESKLKEIEAEQAGIGDASTENVEKAETRLQELKIKVEQEEDHNKKIDKEYEEKKQIWQWQLEKIETEKKLKVLEEEKKTNEERKQMLQQAEQAVQVKPYVEAKKESEVQLAAAEKRYVNFNNQLNESKKLWKNSEELYNLAKSDREKNEPIFLLKEQQLVQAQKDLDEISHMKKELSILQNQVVDLEKETESKHEQLKREQAFKNIANEKQKRIKNDLTQNKVPYETKEQVRKAVEEKREILRQEQTRQEVNKELSNVSNEFEYIKNEYNTRENVAANIFEKINLNNQSITNLFHQVCEREKEADELLFVVKDLLESEKKQLEKLKTAELASVLSRELKLGEACPVCGALEHPNPAKHKEVSNTHTENHIDSLEKYIDSMKEIKHDLQAFKHQLEQVSAQLVDFVEEKVQSDLPNVPFIIQKSINELKIAEVFQWCQKLQGEIRALKQDVLQVEALSKKNIKEYQNIEQELFKLKHSYETQSKSKTNLEQKIETLDLEISQAISRWKESFNSLDWDLIEENLETINHKEKHSIELQESLEKSYPFIEEKETNIQKFKDEISKIDIKKAELKSRYEEQERNINEQQSKITTQIGEEDIGRQISNVQSQLAEIKLKENEAYQKWQTAQKQVQDIENEFTASKQSYEESKLRLEKAKQRLIEEIRKTSLTNEEHVESAFASKKQMDAWKDAIEQYNKSLHQLTSEKMKYMELLNGQGLSEEMWVDLQTKREVIKQALSQLREEKGAAEEQVKELRQKHERYNALEEQRTSIIERKEMLGKLQYVFRGNAFVEFLAEEQLLQVSRSASERLQQLTRGRYAIEVDSNGGFVIRDDANGGVRRPVSTLSGGETFLTSLALALSLSGQIQLRGEYPLEFFFLDEGFGTLDQELLDTVITALEKLHSERLSVGVISHVQELRARLPRKLIVTPAEPSGRGSLVTLEVL